MFIIALCNKIRLCNDLQWDCSVPLYLILYLQDTFLEYLVLCKILFEDTFTLHNEVTFDPAFVVESNSEYEINLTNRKQHL